MKWNDVEFQPQIIQGDDGEQAHCVKTCPAYRGVKRDGFPSCRCGFTATPGRVCTPYYLFEVERLRALLALTEDDMTEERARHLNLVIELHAWAKENRGPLKAVDWDGFLSMVPSLERSLERCAWCDRELVEGVRSELLMSVDIKGLHDKENPVYRPLCRDCEDKALQWSRPRSG